VNITEESDIITGLTSTEDLLIKPCAITGTACHGN